MIAAGTPVAVVEADGLAAEFEWLDVLIQREILRLRAADQLSLDEFRGLYISDAQVDALVDAAVAADAETTPMLTARAARMASENAARRSGTDRWDGLASTFGLDPIDRSVLLLAVAPEFDRKYETLCAYLNNDVAQPWPTIDLALRLFAAGRDERAAVQRRLTPQAPLLADGLLEPVARRAGSTWRSTPIVAARPIVAHLMDLPAVDPALLDRGRWVEPVAGWEDLGLDRMGLDRLRRVAPLVRAPGGPLVVLTGPDEMQNRVAAASVCGEIGIPLFELDPGATGAGRDEPAAGPGLIARLRLRQRLERTGLLVPGIDAHLDDEWRLTPTLETLVRGLRTLPGPVFLTGSWSVPWSRLLQGTRHVRFDLGIPEPAARASLWADTLAGRGLRPPATPVIRDVADRFALTATQIRDAVRMVADEGALADLGPSPALADLAEAARSQADVELGGVVDKVHLGYGWNDLILPEPTLRHIHEVADAIRHAPTVYGRWGFDRHSPAGRGVKTLFAGASGTGKTMTAAVIAQDLSLDLYKIDLSAVVSKYIGETEKNLDRVFRSARRSSALLFFDEADALFGKRSEVKDAHDRYANVEVAYLLQRLEEHDGAVILASNLSKNIDPAFSRRLHYVIELPQPDEQLRIRLWRGMFPTTAPLDDDVDIDFLASQFSLTGGDIRNVALDAAFLAAADGGPIAMRHLVRAMARQLMKSGRAAHPSDFKQYHALIG